MSTSLPILPLFPTVSTDIHSIECVVDIILCIIPVLTFSCKLQSPRDSLVYINSFMKVRRPQRLVVLSLTWFGIERAHYQLQQHCP